MSGRLPQPVAFPANNQGSIHGVLDLPEGKADEERHTGQTQNQDGTCIQNAAVHPSSIDSHAESLDTTFGVPTPNYHERRTLFGF
jgi:hypothetical protein